MKRAFVVFAVAAMIAAAGAAVYGQSRRWAKPYEDARNAVKASRWDDAIRHLNAAIAADDRQNPDKPTDGVFTEKYFPFIYRGLAYLRKGDLDNAQKDFTRGFQDQALFPPELVGEFNGYRNELNRKLDARRPPPTPPPGPPNPPPPGPTGPTPFERDAQEAQGFLDKKQFAEAARRYTALRAQNPTEFARLNLGPKRDQALRGQADEIAGVGRGFLNDGKIGEARSKFEEADRVSLGAGTQGLKDATTREQDYRKAVSDAQAAQAANNLAGAIQLFERAKGLWPQQFATENHASTVDGLTRRRDNTAKEIENQKEAVRLLGVGRGLASSKRYTEAEASYQQALAKDPNNVDAKDLLDKSRQFGEASAEAKRFKQQNSLAAASGPVRRAQSLDKSRFDADRELVDLLKAIESQVSGSDTLRVGLVNCLQGKWKDAVAVLSPLAHDPQGLDSLQRAHAHAYLAVSHATGALMSTSPDEAQQLSKQAIAEFRLAQQLQPGYQLSDRMVSPRIRQMLAGPRTP
jgi:tetratricopeptide (TPR) repeat protein